MEKKSDILKKYFKESMNNYAFYLKKFQKILMFLKEDTKYERILEYIKAEDEKNFKIYFLFFLHYHKWINPYNIRIFPFQDHFKIIKKESNDIFEKQIIDELVPEKMIEIFIYWYFYILMIFPENLKENNDNDINSNNNIVLLINDIKNILHQSNNKIMNIYEKSKIKTEEVFTFAYIYIFWIEYYTRLIPHEKDLKTTNSIIFELLFDLLQKISIKILKENNIKQKINIKILYSFLEELKTNVFIHNDYNIIILLDNNIIQPFIENFLINIQPITMNSMLPNYSDKLADFYSSFVKFRFNKGKIMDFFINNVKNSLVNLRYFNKEKEKIINDILIQKFQSDLIQKIFIQESNKNADHPTFNSFLFNGNNSKMSFKLRQFSLNNNIIIFSFFIKPNAKSNHLTNIKQPLVCFHNYNKELILKVCLSEIDSNKSNELNKDKIKYNIKIFLNNNSKEITLNQLDAIETNTTYYICIYLNNSFIQTYLYSSYQNNSKYMELVGEYEDILKEEELLLNIGYDDITIKRIL